MAIQIFSQTGHGKPETADQRPETAGWF